MLPYEEKSKNFTHKKPTKTNRRVEKGHRYKMHVQKKKLFLYTSKLYPENKIKKTSFTMT